MANGTFSSRNGKLTIGKSFYHTFYCINNPVKLLNQNLKEENDHYWYSIYNNGQWFIFVLYVFYMYILNNIQVGTLFIKVKTFFMWADLELFKISGIPSLLKALCQSQVVNLKSIFIGCFHCCITTPLSQVMLRV